MRIALVFYFSFLFLYSCKPENISINTAPEEKTVKPTFKMEMTCKLIDKTRETLYYPFDQDSSDIYTVVIKLTNKSNFIFVLPYLFRLLYF